MHLLTVSDLSLSYIIKLLDRASYMKTYKGDMMKHKILTTIFYEPSTRTSCSFQAAMLKLGGSVINVNVDQSSIKKGESLEDTIRTMSCYSDCIVIRHPNKSFVTEASKVSSKPIINAGDGDGEHPTQALLDLFTIQNELGRIESMTITIVGDLKYGRTVHSLVKLLTFFNNIKLIYISPKELSMPDEIIQYVSLEQRTDLSIEEAIKITDVLYVTRIQKERFDSNIEPIVINANLMKLAKKNMIVMHPLPRLTELSTDMDSDPRSAYFRQMENGMYMRMAILENMLMDF